MNKRDQFIGECIDYTHDGLGVVKHDNTTIFVKNLLLHETAKIEIIKVLKSYCVGRVVELQTPSSERIEPKFKKTFCPFFNTGISIVRLHHVTPVISPSGPD